MPWKWLWDCMQREAKAPVQQHVKMLQMQDKQHSMRSSGLTKQAQHIMASWDDWYVSLVMFDTVCRTGKALRAIERGPLLSCTGCPLAAKWDN